MAPAIRESTKTVRSVKVEITHFINAHLFWIRRISGTEYNFENFEENFQQKFESKQKAKNVVQHRVNDIVAVFYTTLGKWLRCEIDKIDNKKRNCIVWSIDYGFPFQTSLESIVLIDDEKIRTTDCQRIAKMALANVIPTNSVSLS